ncbi:lysyl oxidase family protein [Amycolatopsis sp. PS_44_ISF1]|uniref:lysyl oxidase family protein n=1 Tax=Amycolatopsis sp. PS_44_ISF1 TaxID=2974917 RepID=UPI0028DF0C8D|nr:lysyl oxidase family protein [Amycolatopsis sp. PS_44_ISF1]MDT8910135.1 lysyl oxidase family protein [Amycolatopsis sp. PS_44_ISF1]
MRSSLFTKCVTLAAVLLATAATVSAPGVNAASTLLLPDLRQAPPGCPGGYAGDPAQCGDWDVCPVIDPGSPNGRCVGATVARAVRLRFTSSEENIGDGPLLLYGVRNSTEDKTMSVRQALRTSGGWIPPDYAAAQRPTRAYTYYETAMAHQHWHLMDFDHFALVSKSGATVVTDRKTGFCLGDRYSLPDVSAPHEAPDGPDAELARSLRANNCRHHEPDALNVVEGISVGSGDDYTYQVDYQWLDITQIPSGTYDLVNTVNDDRTLAETNYDNNSSSVSLSIEWPQGRPAAGQPVGKAPVVKILRSCPGAARCS